jgi:glycosyltransferase involved in cell wall biosynthesis
MIKRFHNCLFWIWEMDIYPDVATALGAIRPGSTGARLIGRLMHAFRRRADGVIVVGSCMRDRLLDEGLDPKKVFVAENWSDSSVIQQFDFPAPTPLRILYSGNLGLAHETETIGQVILRLRNEKHVRFIFAGGGSRQQEIKALCEQHDISNVTFEPYVDRQDLGERLAECHLGLVTLRNECAGTLVPSKVYSFLAAGRPFLYIGPQDSTVFGIAEKGCGWHREPGDVEGIISLIAQLSSDREPLKQASRQARLSFLEQYDKPHGPRRIANLLLSGFSRSHSPARRLAPRSAERAELGLVGKSAQQLRSNSASGPS